MKLEFDNGLSATTLEQLLQLFIENGSMLTIDGQAQSIRGMYEFITENVLQGDENPHVIGRIEALLSNNSTSEA